MTARVYITISSTRSGALLFLRDEIEKLNPSIEWDYDDGVQELEMERYQKWPEHEEQLSELSARYPAFGLSWEVVSE